MEVGEKEKRGRQRCVREGRERERKQRERIKRKREREGETEEERETPARDQGTSEEAHLNLGPFRCFLCAWCLEHSSSHSPFPPQQEVGFGTDPAHCPMVH